MPRSGRTRQVRTIRLYGIAKFEEPIRSTAEVLGSVFPISIAGISGHLAVPTLPDSFESEEDRLSFPLVAPLDAKNWTTGDSEIGWGSTSGSASGSSLVNTVLLYFDLRQSVLKSAGTAIHRGFDQWRDRFVNAWELLTKRRNGEGLFIEQNAKDLDLFYWSKEGSAELPYDNDLIVFRRNPLGESAALTRTQFRRLCVFASTEGELPLEYRIQLEAYRAFGMRDYRKATVETAVAAEIALTRAIRSKVQVSALRNGERLLDRFRTLGGRIDLARIVEVALPELNLKARLVEPRNAVVHGADFANQRQALGAIEATDEILELLSGPPIAEEA